MLAVWLMEAEAVKGYRVVLLAVIAVVEFFKALVVVLEAVVEFFKALVVVLEAVVVEATTVQGVVNKKPVMPLCISSLFSGNE
jgi:general stress protein CsbA